MARLEKILYYPIKSLGGQEVDFCNIKNNRIHQQNFMYLSGKCNNHIMKALE